MTRIQLRRDTSTNWATNNPVPSVGEPCFEIDTGKLKIGDGSTKYSDLPYQGGGSSGGGAEIDDTTTSASKVWSSSKTSSEITSKQNKLATGNNITIDEGTNTISATNVITTNTTQAINNDAIMKSFGTSWTATNEAGLFGCFNAASIYMGYGSNSDNNPHIKNYSEKPLYIQTDTSRTKNRGLKIASDTLSFINSSGEETDLLAGGGGATIDDTTTSTDTVWSSNKVNTELGNKQDTLPSTDAGYAININGTNVAGSTVYFGGNTSASLAPHAKADTTNHVLNINGYGADGSGITMYDTVLKTNSFKYGDRTNQYEVVNKSPDNNTYMAHMAMPSDTYVDLTLGASGTTYTAPADGYIYIRRYASSSNTVTNAYFAIVFSSNYTVEQRAQQLNWSKATEGEINIFIPVKKDVDFKVIYRDFSATTDANRFRFIYAVGSEPTA